MVTPFDVSSQDLSKEVAQGLKGKIESPKWVPFVKTGSHKERPPLNKDWWYIRAASILRTIYKNGAPVGVSKLRSKYGGRKNMGSRPHQFRKASGSVIRKILQQLEKAGLVSYKKEGVHKGRIVTPAGVSLLTKAAASVKAKK